MIRRIMFIRDIVSVIEDLAPGGLQESWDNSGLLTGRPDWLATGALVCLDVTLPVLEEAVRKECNLVVSHHPAFFSAMKRFSGHSLQEQVLNFAIRNDLALYGCHTNLDSAPRGVSGRMADLLGLTRQRILVPRENDLVKLVCFIPLEHVDQVAKAIFEAGAGVIGQYDSCSFQAPGNGTFRAAEGTKPYVGGVGSHHREPEVRFETILPRRLQGQVIRALIAAHPYEEVAYDLYPLLNVNPANGLGIVGNLPRPEADADFLARVKEVFRLKVLKHSVLPGRMISRVAVCGGSGSEFLKQAQACDAEVFLTADIRYHQWFGIEDGMILADLGHFESEQFAIQVLAEAIIEKFPTFAVCLTEVDTNPINYLT